MWCSPGRGKGGQGASHHHRHPHTTMNPVVFTDIDPSVQNCLNPITEILEDMATTNIPWHLCICTNTPCPIVFGSLSRGKGWLEDPVVLLMLPWTPIAFTIEAHEVFTEADLSWSQLSLPSGVTIAVPLHLPELKPLYFHPDSTKDPAIGKTFPHWSRSINYRRDSCFF